MSRKDPYSTPARRRRIVAEVAKKTLREYCIIACGNVAVVRKRTKSAILLQCAFRAYSARKHTTKLRFLKQYKAATKIQTVLRAKLACRRVKKLMAERHLRRQIRLAQVINNLRNSRKNRMAWLAFLIAKRIAREKRQRKAAIEMQRVFRGHTARIIYRRMYQEHLAKIRQRNQAAILIQSCMRRFLAIQSYLYWLTRRKAGWVIFNAVITWWERRKRTRKRRAKTIQRYWRGCLGRMYAAKQHSERERQRELVRLRESLLLQALLLEEVTAELTHLTAECSLPEEHTMHIHVDVSVALVQRMIAAGPGYVVAWCLDNSIVNYRHTSGYSAGAVVQQVVRSVDLALHAPMDSPTKHSTGEDHPQGGEKVVALSSWDEGTAADKQHDSILPTNWSEIAFDTAPASPTKRASDYSHQNGVPNGAGLSVDNVSTHSIHLHITTLHFDEQSQQHTRNIVTIVFNSPHDSPACVEGATSNGLDSEQATDLSEVKFRFKNVQVYLDSPAPVTPEVTIPEETEPPELEVFEDSGSSEDEELVVPVVQEVRARPTTAVVRIVLREPTPPPPPIDFDAKALTLQMLLRRKYLHKSRFARRIQRFTRRSRIISTWQDAVYSVLEIAHDAATIVQCWLRRAAAQRLLQRMKDEYERAHFVYGHDFTLSEQANWAAFGLDVSGADDSYCEELCRRPVLQLSTQHLKNSTQSAKTSSQPQRERLLPVAQLPAAGEVLRLIEYPAPPPGCLPRPAATQETDQFSVFTMLDLSGQVGAMKTDLKESSAPSGTEEGVVDNHIHFPDSFMQQLAVRRFIGDSSSHHQHTHKTSADNSSTGAIPPDQNGPIEDSALQKWHQEHLGDILNESSSELASLGDTADFFQENFSRYICNDPHRENVNHTSPIYGLLARKFL